MKRILFVLFLSIISVASAMAGLQSVEPKLGVAFASVSQGDFKSEQTGAIIGIQLNFENVFLHAAYVDEFDLHSEVRDTTYVKNSMINVAIGLPYKIHNRWKLYGMLGYESWETEHYFWNSYVGSDSGVTPWVAFGAEFSPFWKVRLMPQIEVHQDVGGSRMTLMTFLLGLEF